MRSIADIAPTVPGLNVNSDSVGRAFVSIRGIGTALQAGVQPGVGVFQDGMYAPQTSYINNPTLDIQRIEVLRGPQGTLYGKNTLGGAINIITRPPSETFEGKFYASYTDRRRRPGIGRPHRRSAERIRAREDRSCLARHGRLLHQQADRRRESTNRAATRSTARSCGMRATTCASR